MAEQLATNFEKAAELQLNIVAQATGYFDSAQLEAEYKQKDWEDTNKELQKAQEKAQVLAERVEEAAAKVAATQQELAAAREKLNKAKAVLDEQRKDAEKLRRDLEEATTKSTVLKKWLNGKVTGEVLRNAVLRIFICAVQVSCSPCVAHDTSCMTTGFGRTSSTTLIWAWIHNISGSPACTRYVRRVRENPCFDAGSTECLPTVVHLPPTGQRNSSRVRLASK